MRSCLLLILNRCGKRWWTGRLVPLAALLPIVAFLLLVSIVVWTVLVTVSQIVRTTFVCCMLSWCVAQRLLRNIDVILCITTFLFFYHHCTNGRVLTGSRLLFLYASKKCHHHRIIHTRFLLSLLFTSHLHRIKGSILLKDIVSQAFHC